MWFERFVIIVPGLSHEYEPWQWSGYVPTIVDYSILIGSFGWFFMWFLLFIRQLPVLAISEVKEIVPPKLKRVHHHPPEARRRLRSRHAGRVRMMQGMLGAFQRTRRDGRRDRGAEERAPRRASRSTRRRRATSSNTRCSRRSARCASSRSSADCSARAFGYWIAIWCSEYWPLVVGGKAIATWIPFTVFSFELMVLIGGSVDGRRIVHLRGDSAAHDDGRLRRPLQSRRLSACGSSARRTNSKMPKPFCAAAARWRCAVRNNAMIVRLAFARLLPLVAMERLRLVHRFQAAAVGAPVGRVLRGQRRAEGFPRPAGRIGRHERHADVRSIRSRIAAAARDDRLDVVAREPGDRRRALAAQRPQVFPDQLRGVPRRARRRQRRAQAARIRRMVSRRA